MQQDNDTTGLSFYTLHTGAYSTLQYSELIANSTVTTIRRHLLTQKRSRVEVVEGWEGMLASRLRMPQGTSAPAA